MFLWGHYLIDEGSQAASNLIFRKSRERDAITINSEITTTASSRKSEENAQARKTLTIE